jgi:hypothetical protein
MNERAASVPRVWTATGEHPRTEDRLMKQSTMMIWLYVKEPVSVVFAPQRDGLKISDCCHYELDKYS